MTVFVNGIPSTASMFNVGLVSQIITFAALPNLAFGSSPFTVAATASSGLPVTFQSMTTSVCTVAGSTVSLVAAGTCTVAADQSGNSVYGVAPEVTQSFSILVGQTPQTITFPPIPVQPSSEGSFTLSATDSAGLTISYISSTSAVCTVSGNRVTLLTTGTCTITASQAGNGTYGAANPVTQSFAVELGQTITFPAISSQNTSASPIPLAATATSGLPVTYSATPSSVCSVSGNSLTLSSAGLCTVTASQAGNATYAPAPSSAQIFSVSGLNSQTIKFAAIASEPLAEHTFTLGVSATSGLPVTVASQTSSVCSVNGTTVTLIALGTCTLQATQAGNANYLPATPVTRSFSVTNGSVTNGSGGDGSGDGPVPPWALMALGLALMGLLKRNQKKAA
jgi:hypothetical protein